MLLSLTSGEMLFSSSRRALSLATPNMIAAGLSAKEVGTIASSLSCVYALSKFSAAIATDRMSCRVLFCVGLVGAGVPNLLFAVGSITSPGELCAHWTLNGLFQGGHTRHLCDVSLLCAVWCLTLSVSRSVCDAACLCRVKQLSKGKEGQEGVDLQQQCATTRSRSQ